jgi:hypothetical protein
VAGNLEQVGEAGNAVTGMAGLGSVFERSDFLALARMHGILPAAARRKYRDIKLHETAGGPRRDKMPP